MNDKKKILMSVLGVFILIVAVTGVSIAFFNYTRTGNANTLKTGRIYFNSGQSDTINLTNVFPVDTSEGIPNDPSNVGTVNITVQGDTMYSEGIEYLISATNVTNTVGTKSVPISISATASGTLGTEDEDYFYNREESTSHIYKVLAKDTISNNDQLMVGYIAKGATGINGTITIKAYLDKDKIAISDTYDGTESDNMGTTTNWVKGRTVLTTTEWNSLSSTGISFQVKVEANEGIWVDEIPTVNTMNTFPSVITDQKANIKEIYFNKMSSSAMINAYDNATIKSDLTYNNEGKVLAWLEPDAVDNTKYIMYVASTGKTYLITGAGLFSEYTSVEKIYFNNIDTSRVTNMQGMFRECTNLSELDLSMFNTDNVTAMSTMFYNCSSLTSLNLDNFSMSSISENISSGVGGMFVNCSSLMSLDLSFMEILYGNTDIFTGCTNLVTLDLSGVKRIVGTIQFYFSGCGSLTTIYVSSTWDASNQPDGMPIFSNNTHLIGKAPNTTYAFDSSKVDKAMAVIATDSTPGYLTDISLKLAN